MNDPEIRKLLRPWLATTRPDSLVVDEIPLRTRDRETEVTPSRVDVLCVGSLIEGFEIKGDGDSWVRMRNQIASYAMVCERVWVVTTASKAHLAIFRAPDWCGVLYVANDSSGRVTVLREAKPHELFRFKALRHVLRVGEWKKALKRRGEKVAASSLAAWVWKLVERHLTIPEMLDEIRTQLPQRKNWR